MLTLERMEERFFAELLTNETTREKWLEGEYQKVLDYRKKYGLCLYDQMLDRDTSVEKLTSLWIDNYNFSEELIEEIYEGQRKLEEMYAERRRLMDLRHGQRYVDYDDYEFDD